MRPTDAAVASIWPSKHDAKSDRFQTCIKAYENRPRDHVEPPDLPTRLPEEPLHGVEGFRRADGRSAGCRLPARLRQPAFGGNPRGRSRFCSHVKRAMATRRRLLL